jgi:hypothetical protein
MPDTTTLLTPATIIASTSVAAGTPQRAAYDLRGKHGGLLTVKITNGGTPPGAQAVATVHVAHDSGTTPAVGAAGAVWKTLAVLGGGGLTASAVSEFPFPVPPCCHFQVEIAGNTSQAVTAEAFFTEYTKLVTT